MADLHKNFAYGTILTAPSPALSGVSLVLNTGQGANFPTPPFNVTIWPAGAQPTVSNAEIARCTALATDTMTIVRSQESSISRTVVVGDQIMAGITAKTLKDIENPAAILDSNGKVIINLNPATTAVNWPQADNAATATNPVIGFEAVGSDANIHFQAIAKGSALTKVSILRQDDTTNSYKHNSVILTGWGVGNPGATAVLSETVTFGITFAQRPIVVLTYGGDNTAASTAYGGGAVADAGDVTEWAHTITTTNFVARLQRTGTWNGSTTVFYQWIAIGEF